MNIWDEHRHPGLEGEDLGADPLAVFGDWFKQAEKSCPMPDAMTLATADEDGAPDARMVLLKGVGPDGFRFFTNFGSAKAGQLEAEPRAALVFHWLELDRQVRVRGKVQRLPEAESDRYFATRDRLSQLGAWASPQSRPITGREELEDKLTQVAERFGGLQDGAPVARPQHWGGFQLTPFAFEFWQGRKGRLHDRIRYVRDGEAWRVQRLAP